MYYGPPILSSPSIHGPSSHTAAYHAICHRFLQAQNLDEDEGVVIVATKNEVDSICAAVLFLKLLSDDGVDAIVCPVVDEVWHRIFLGGMKNYISEERWQKIFAKTGAHPEKSRISSVVYVDPRDDIPVEDALKDIPADVPIHIISSRTLNDACFYKRNITRIIVWHDKYSDPDIDKAIDLDPHAIDLRTVRPSLLTKTSIDEFLNFDARTTDMGKLDHPEGSENARGQLQRLQDLTPQAHRVLSSDSFEIDQVSGTWIITHSMRVGRLSCIGLAGLTYARYITSYEHRPQYNEVMDFINDLSDDGGLIKVSDSQLVGFAYGSLHETLYSTTYLSGNFGWWKRHSSPSLDDIQSALELDRNQFDGLWRLIDPKTQTTTAAILLSTLRKKAPFPYLHFPSCGMEQDEDLGAHSISAGEAAEIAYAVLCSATSLLPEPGKRDDPGKAGHWFRGGSVFETQQPGAYPLDTLFDPYDEPAESLHRWSSWEEEVKKTKPASRRIGYHLKVNVFCVIRMLLTLDCNPSWLSDAESITRHWTFTIPEFAYDVCRSSAIHTKAHHRVIRLDRVSSDGFPNRATPGVLYRIGLAISDILWAQIERRGTSLFVVDALDDAEKTYCLVGLEIAPNRDMPVKRTWALKDLMDARFRDEAWWGLVEGEYDAVWLSANRLELFLNSLDDKLAEHAKLERKRKCREERGGD